MSRTYPLYYSEPFLIEGVFAAIQNFIEPVPGLRGGVTKIIKSEILIISIKGRCIICLLKYS